jgi:predicted amidohydrolase YtcJ
MKLFLLTILTFAAAATLRAADPADIVYRNGYVYTGDAKESVQAALAVRAGKIVYVGGNDGLSGFIGPNTKVVDLRKRMLMPGLVDGHMHPLQGGAQLLKCNLNYEALTLAQFQAKIQACLDSTRAKEPDGWMEVVNWFQQDMLPPGTAATHDTLDVLKTKRPVFVMSSFGHSVLANSRALAMAGVTAKTPDPLGGKIAHDAAGKPSGILEDAAYEKVTKLLPQPTAEDNLAAARAALDALRKQGVTTFLDAEAESPSIEAFSAVQRSGGLTSRAHFAVLIPPAQGANPQKAVAAVQAVAKRYDQGSIQVRPGITVRNAKLFLDGVITAPAFTGAMLAPYFVNRGTAQSPRWEKSANRGPDVYFPAPILKSILMELARAGLEPHMHADGDRAVREGLDGIQVLRQEFAGRDIRAAIAHDEIVDPADFPRFAKLNALQVLSFQWAKPAADTIDGSRDYLGPARFKILEPEGLLAAAGARIAYGSDWPVDALDEWFALKVGVTRTNAPSAGDQYAGRLGEDPGLSRRAVIRAITINSSYELHQELETGSLEVGKLADLIVLDRNFFDIPPAQIAGIKVLQTVVGGKVIYQASDF